MMEISFSITRWVQLHTNFFTALLFYKNTFFTTIFTRTLYCTFFFYNNRTLYDAFVL